MEGVLTWSLTSSPSDSSSPERPRPVSDSSPGDSPEARIRRRLRVIAVGVFLMLIFLLPIFDALGIGRTDYRVDTLIYGGLVTAVLVLLGVEGAERLFKR